MLAASTRAAVAETVGNTLPETVDEPTPDTVAPPTEPADTAPPVSTQPAPDSGDGATPDTSLSGNDTGVNDSNTPVSIWWWVAGGLIAAAAIYGLAFSLRRRTADEDWARAASTTCDIGRAMSLSLDRHLAEADSWAPPDRYTEQQPRFDAELAQLATSAPGSDFPVLLHAVTVDNDALRAAVTATRIGTPIAAARVVIEPLLERLGDSLTALEHEATITVFGASLPSSRTTG